MKKMPRRELHDRVSKVSGRTDVNAFPGVAGPAAGRAMACCGRHLLAAAARSVFDG
jgi:hypothetical protein